MRAAADSLTVLCCFGKTLVVFGDNTVVQTNLTVLMYESKTKDALINTGDELIITSIRLNPTTQ